MNPSTGVTISALRLRAGPGTENPTLVILIPGTRLTVRDQVGDWLKVSADGHEGFVHKDFVRLDARQVPEGFLAHLLEPGGPLAELPLEPPSDQWLSGAPGAPTFHTQVANTWNAYGGLVGQVARMLGIDPAVAVAVLVAESGGRLFGPDGRMIIRFENHIFFRQWGQSNPAPFNACFRYDESRPWTGHQWCPAGDALWQDCHRGGQASEWAVFGQAQRMADRAAKRSISMGGAQIMGFNHARLGYESAEAMFDAFATSGRGQIVGFFDFIKGPGTSSGKIVALQNQDYESFASQYNGPGQAAAYAAIIRARIEAFHQLQPATRGITRRRGARAPARQRRDRKSRR